MSPTQTSKLDRDQESIDSIDFGTIENIKTLSTSSRVQYMHKKPLQEHLGISEITRVTGLAVFASIPVHTEDLL